MDLKDALFQIARDTSNIDLDKLNNLKAKADADVSQWGSEMSGYKGLYARLHKGWLLQLALMLCIPLVSAWILKKKNEIMFSSVDDEPNEVQSPFDVNNFL